MSLLFQTFSVCIGSDGGWKLPKQRLDRDTFVCILIVAKVIAAIACTCM